MFKPIAFALALAAVHSPAFAGPVSSMVAGKTVKCGKVTFEFANNALKAKVGSKYEDVAYDSAGVYATIGENILQYDGGAIYLDDDKCRIGR